MVMRVSCYCFFLLTYSDEDLDSDNANDENGDQPELSPDQDEEDVEDEQPEPVIHNDLKVFLAFHEPAKCWQTVADIIRFISLFCTLPRSSDRIYIC